MRRILIFILLGIICYSTITSIQPSVSKHESYKVMIDTVHGMVPAGNFTYWTFGQKGPLIIELCSIRGDADLFVSDNLRPSFEADKNNFSSETCGMDVVFIPEEFPRPIGIGVFGHWSHPWSEFSMKVFIDMMSVNSKHRSTDSETDRRRKETSVKREDVSTFADTESKRTEVFARKEEQKHRFLQLFKVLDTVFDLFVL